MAGTNRTRFVLPRVTILIALWLLIPCFSVAHPMGNFSINHYAGIRVERTFVDIRYVIDMAEIPTFQTVQQNGLVANPEDASARMYLSKQAETLRARLKLTLDHQPLALQTESAECIFPPGAGGLPTMKLAFIYRAAIADQPAAIGGEHALHYRDENFPGHVGWKEVVATAGSEVTLVKASVPAADRSSELSNYPTDLVSSPPLDLEANLSLRWQYVSTGQQAPTATPIHSATAGVGMLKAVGEAKSADSNPGPTALSRANTGKSKSNVPESQDRPASKSSLQPNRQGTPQSRFTQLMTSNQFGIWFLVGAATIAAGLGALHALEPGHGKTIVAAYLVGSKGTAYHAFLLGLIVTASHTASVYALGAVTLYASRYIVPEQLYPWLGAISGLLIAALGSYLFLQRYAGNEIGHSHGLGGHHHHLGHELAHSDGTVHNHDGYEHSHEPQDNHKIHGDVSYRQLLALGITGGIVPCPAALVVLLSAVALNRVGFGLFLIVAFSVGLAAVLIAVGMLMVYARRFVARFRTEGLLTKRWLPLTSAAVITFLGLAIAARSLVTGGILQIRL